MMRTRAATEGRPYSQISVKTGRCRGGPPWPPGFALPPSSLSGYALPVSKPTNFAQLILRHAETVPDRLALILPSAWDDAAVTEQTTATYGELAHRVAQFSTGLRTAGFSQGDRIVVLLPVCLDLYAFVLAVMANGMTVVFIDAGMGARRLIQAVKLSHAKAVVSVHALMRHRFWLPGLWGRKKYSHDSTGLGLHNLSELATETTDAPDICHREFDDEALITFTSGSTGTPKGADRTHGLLTEQHLAMAEHFPIEDEDIDMTCFPVVALHDLCCGITVALPPGDLGAPATIAPAPVLAQAAKLGATSLSGAPAYFGTLTKHMLDTDTQLPGVRRLFVGGAPVPAQLMNDVLAAFPDADSQIVYGSTEAEPIASILMREAQPLDGEGHVVGVPAPMVELELVTLPTTPPTLNDSDIEPYRVAPGEVGEVIVRGKHVNQRYVDNPEADRECKLRCVDGRIWHRTGDLARQDEQGRLWITGRLKDAIVDGELIIQPYVVEAAIIELDCVESVALVAHEKAPGGEVAVVAAAKHANDAVRRAVSKRLSDVELGGLSVVVVERIPMDPRHNSKIDRPTLRKWLAKR